MILTLVDASVLIYAAKKPTADIFSRHLSALKILGDPGREFAATDFLRMEVVPLAVYFDRKRETRFYETFFDSAVKWVETEVIVKPAYELACEFGIGAMDALHIAAANTSEPNLSLPKNQPSPFTRRIKISFVSIDPANKTLKTKRAGGQSCPFTCRGGVTVPPFWRTY